MHTTAVQLPTLQYSTLARVLIYTIASQLRRNGCTLGDVNTCKYGAGRHHDGIVGKEGDYHFFHKVGRCAYLNFTQLKKAVI